MNIAFNLHSTEMSKICTNIIKSIRKHVIRIFGMVFIEKMFILIFELNKIKLI